MVSTVDYLRMESFICFSDSIFQKTIKLITLKKYKKIEIESIEENNNE